MTLCVCSGGGGVQHVRPRLSDAHLIVTIARDLNARLLHLHVHHQTLHHR